MKSQFNSIVFLFLLSISFDTTESHICDDGIIDTISVLKNGTILLFHQKEVYFMNKDILSEPHSVKEVFNEIEGPIDAAVTILSHDTITEFVGSSIYFESGTFYAFKNLGPYQVEWGNLVYLPHKGSQTDIGKIDPNSMKAMKLKMNASYFDPIDSRTRFVFTDGTVLGFNFELGTEYDKPVVSNLSFELKKYGVVELPASVDAAFIQKKTDIPELYLFSESNFCSFKMALNLKDQKCVMKPTTEGFLNCKGIKSGNKTGDQTDVSIKPGTDHKDDQSVDKMGATESAWWRKASDAVANKDKSNILVNNSKSTTAKPKSSSSGPSDHLFITILLFILKTFFFNV